MQPETAFKIKVMKRLKALEGIWLFKSQEVAVRGIPDIIGCFRGRFFAIELKRDLSSEADELQKYNLERIRKSGGLSFVWCPENYEQYLEQFFINPNVKREKATKGDGKAYRNDQGGKPSKKVYYSSDLR